MRKLYLALLVVVFMALIGVSADTASAQSYVEIDRTWDFSAGETDGWRIGGNGTGEYIPGRGFCTTEVNFARESIQIEYRFGEAVAVRLFETTEGTDFYSKHAGNGAMFKKIDGVDSNVVAPTATASGDNEIMTFIFNSTTPSADAISRAGRYNLPSPLEHSTYQNCISSARIVWWDYADELVAEYAAYSYALVDRTWDFVAGDVAGWSAGPDNGLGEYISGRGFCMTPDRNPLYQGTELQYDFGENVSVHAFLVEQETGYYAFHDEYMRVINVGGSPSPLKVTSRITTDVLTSFYSFGGENPVEGVSEAVRLNTRRRLPDTSSHEAYKTCVTSARFIYRDYTPEPEPPETLYTRPLTLSNTGEAGIVPSPEDTTTPVTYAFSIDPGKNVHSATDGTIVDMRQATVDDCDDMLGIESADDYINLDGRCRIKGIDDLSAPQGSVSGLFVPPRLDTYILGVVNAVAKYITLGAVQFNPYIDIEIVTVLDDDGYYWRYWVRNSLDYVQIGLDISAGCALGETVALESYGLQFESFNPADLRIFLLESSQGFGAVVMPDALTGDEIIPPNGIEPGLGNCSKPAQYAGCLGSFEDFYKSTWTLNNAEFYGVNSVKIHNGSVSANYNVDLDRAPHLYIAWRPEQYADALFYEMANIPILSVSFGDQQYDFSYVDEAAQYGWVIVSLADLRFLTTDIDLSGATPTESSFYNLEILSPTSLDIAWICVSHTLDADAQPELPQQPGTCYFNDYSFDSNNAAGAWTTSSEDVSFEGGSAVVPSGDWIEQNVHLYPGDGVAQTYYLEIDWGIRDVGENWIYGNDTLSVTLNYDWGSFTSGYVPLSGTPQVTIIQKANYVDIQSTILLNTEIDAGFRIQPVITNPGDGTIGIEIYRVCISSDSWPGYREDTPPPPPFSETCDVVSVPTSNSIGPWIQYHWRQLNRFFQCDLMVLLNQWYDDVNTFFDTVRWFFRWLIVVAQMTLDWLSTDVLYWLNGHLANIAQGQVTFVEVEGSQEYCNNIFCAADALFSGLSSIVDSIGEVLVTSLEEVLGPVVDFIIGAGEAILDFILDFINRLIQLLFDLIDFLIDLVRHAGDLLAWLTGAVGNAEPTEIPILPYCSTAPEENLACRVFWMLDNTVLSGTGDLIIPTLTGGLYVLLTIWVIKKIKTLVTEAGGLT